MSKYDRYAKVHNFADHDGPGDKRTTALEVVQDNELVNRWRDKVVFITECSSGIGIETAKAMRATGARVYVTVRNIQKGEDALKDILEPNLCELLELKLDSLNSVRACAAAFQAKESKLNILINNAGVMAIQERTLTEDGFEAQIGTNHHGHFLLFHLLKSNLLAASSPEFHSRVVNVSSSGHRRSIANLDDINLAQPGAYSGWVGYGHSKTATIWMANEIERRFGSGNSLAMQSGQAIHGHSLHPGGIATGLQVHAVDLESIMKKPEVAKHMKSPAQGAATTVWAAVAREWEGSGGATGYAEWVYDEVGAKKLWEISINLLGISGQ